MIGGAPRRPVVKPNYHFLPDNPFQGRVDFAGNAVPQKCRIRAVSRITKKKAEDDLEAAFLYREKAGSDYAVAEHLKSKGYLSVKNFNIVKT